MAASFISSKRNIVYLICFVSLLLSPNLLKSINYTKPQENPISTSIIQANISMRDKWDEELFWKIVKRYRMGLQKLMGKSSLIVMPEAAFPIPASYVSDLLDSISEEAKKHNAAVLLGIPQATTTEESAYYNTMIALGMAEGSYIKQHLVPFGEFIPGPLERLMNWLSIPMMNMKSGLPSQSLIEVFEYPIASLICYELAYPNLLRLQMPKAQLIVAISDDGWFGHSLAMYQQLQISQALSIMTGRYQVVANNDGLSSFIDSKGNIIASLPPFKHDLLNGSIFPVTGTTPWIRLGDYPLLILCLSILFLSIFSRKKGKELS